MPIVFDAGVNEVEEPTLLPPNVLTKGQGAEYRKGRQGIHVAKGRQLRGSASGVTWKGLYYAGFEGGAENQYLIGHAGDTLYEDVIAENMAPATMLALSPGSTPIVGAHYANRHYIALGSQNRCLEMIQGVVSNRDVGMAETTLTVGVSVTQGSGSFTTTTGLTYWLTEYDSERGLESIAGTTAHTGSFTAKDSVVVSVSGPVANSNADTIRVYRSVDGGKYPDGGLAAEFAVTGTGYTDTDTVVNTLSDPLYGYITIGGLDFERDVKPDPLLYIAGPFNNSMLGFLSSEPQAVAFSAEGRPESWPLAYRIPMQTHRQDSGQCIVELSNGVYGVFSRDTIHRLTRIPREIDTAFAAGEALSLVTDERGAVSRKAVVAFTMPGRGSLLMVGCRDGIWVTNLVNFTVPVTDGVDWDTRVDGDKLSQLELVNNSHERRVICYYRKKNGGHGVMYLDYQGETIRITHPDHGAIRSATEAPYKGFLRVFTADARDSNGQVYTEGIQDKDDSNFTTSTGQISFALKTAEIFPAGVQEKRRLGRATWMHSATSDTINHRFTANRESHSQNVKMDFSSREATEVGLEKEVNSFVLQVDSVGSTSYSIDWLDIEGFETARLQESGA